MSGRKSSSNTFTISVVEDGYSVVAQYSPDKVVIHTTFQTGDKYMRTKSTEEGATWSDWQRVVGENGAETDFSFGWSQQTSTAGATTAPTLKAGTTWTDAPTNDPSTASTKYYQWMKIQKKNPDGTNKGVATYQRIQGTDGESPYFADLDNEMDSVPCDSDGNTVQEQLLTTNVNFYKGTTSLKPYTSIECSVDGTTLSTNYVDEASPRSMFKASVNTTTGAVTIGVKGSKPLTREVVTITVTADGQTRNLLFTINGIKAGAQGDAAVLQGLLPSLNEISFARTSSGGLDPASRNLTLSIKKTLGNSTSVQTISQSGLTVKWSYESMPASSSSGNNWGSGTTTGISWSGNTMQVANSVEANNIYIAAFDNGGTLVDRETIAILKDGKHGEDAPSAFATPDAITVLCDEDGNVTAQVTNTVRFFLVVGTESISSFSVTWPQVLPTGVSATSRYTGYVEIGISTSATASGIAEGIPFTVSGTRNGKTYSAKITVALIGSIKGETGSTGARGKIGRFFYYAGEFNSSDSSKTFEVNDAQAPFFKTGINYHVFNYSVNGSYTMAQMWELTETSGNPPAKSFNNYPWESMTNDFKYLITEAIFGEYAHFGASIINGDFMMSQFGYVRGFNGVKQDVADDETYYTNFNSKQPFGTEDLYDSYTSPSQWLISNTVSKYEIESTSYSQLYNYAFNLKSGLWYTIEIDGYCDDNGSLKFMLAKNSSDTPVANGSISGYTNDNTYFPAYVTFKATSDIKNCKIFVRKTQGNAEIKGVYLRKAQFVPHFVVDLRSGEMSADKLNGKLRAKYFDYGVAKSLSTQNIVVGDNSVACLTNQASCAVILPNPAQAEGRIIEVYSASSDWTVMWEGAGVSDNFKLATNSTNNNYRTWWRADGSDSLGTSISYLKLWSDGTVWWILNKIIIDNNNINN